MMQIIKGSVPEFEGRANIPVTYGKVDEKEYYFISGGDLGNGNYIATTNLVEAISAKEEPKNLGIINSEGVEIVPFENKSIKIVNDKYLLVVLTNPISQSVIDVALEKEKVKNSVDSLATSGLITTANAIKESVGTKMALDNGRFIFNDQASEATVYDYEGNNVLNGEYYSYIGLGDTGLYLSKNVVNSPVEKFDFEQKEDSVTTEESVPVEKSVEEETVTEEVNSVQEPVESTEVVDENVQDAEVQATEQVENSTPVEETPVEEASAPVEEEVGSEQELDVSNVDVDQDKIEEALNTEESENVVEETPVEEETLVEENNSVDSELDIESEMPIVDEDINKEDEAMKEKFDSEFKLSLDDYSNEEANYSDDNLYNYHKSDAEKYYEEPVSRGDSILPTAISTMNNLIRQNKEQKEKIEVLDSRNNNLKEKIVSFENIVNKLEGRNQSLENQNRQMEDKLHSQSEIIERQNREINSLREKIDNQRRSEVDLANLLRTAQGVLTSDNNYGYNDDYSDDKFSYGKRVA